MSSNYEDWADWAGDHPEQAEAELRYARERKARQQEGSALLSRAVAALNDCEHAEVSATGHCLDCGDIVAGWEPDDAQMLTQSGTKEPMWEAMDCPDVTDDPFYADFGTKEPAA